ncbi:PIN-like domain-containing protein [Rhodococcus sp. PAE-6]|uniref:PIN-like domain-containing protein n=1 Tax=Rhodococcus sp. PAE-6 TaxID=2972477 RepID=UPI0021B23B80|nr:PIN-like domain-containing protein [Rhodococcus sp. PAE-6]MCT7293992.1 PIN-like domain-containing protein [Rhodococcus sp. PAE-6]
MADDSEPRGLKDLFAPWLRCSTSDEEHFFGNAVISLDANVLLELYRVSAHARDEMIDLLTAVEDRIWIPHQAALEYFRNREGVIYGVSKDISEVSGQIKKFLQDSKDAIAKSIEATSKFRDEHRVRHEWDLESNGVDKKEILKSLQALGDELKAEVERVRDEIGAPEDPSNDPVLDVLDGLFAGKIGDPFGASALKEHVQHAVTFRFPNKIPPGYMDDGKDTDLRKAGDYIMWRQLINHMGSLPSASERLLLFVTNDSKPDWWEGKKNGRWYPAPQLIEEMRDEADSEILVLSSSEFLDRVSKYLNRDVPPDVVEEYKDHEQRESTYAAEIMRDPDFRVAFDRLQFGVSKEGQALADRVMSLGVSKEGQALADRVMSLGVSKETQALADQVKSLGVSKEGQALADRVMSLGVSKETQALADQVKSLGFTPSNLWLADQALRGIPPETWATAERFLRDADLMRTVEDLQKAEGEAPADGYDEEMQEDEGNADQERDDQDS